MYMEGGGGVMTWGPVFYYKGPLHYWYMWRGGGVMTWGPVFYYKGPLHYWCIWRGGGVDDTRTCVLLWRVTSLLMYIGGVMTWGPVFYYKGPLHYWCIWRGVWWHEDLCSTIKGHFITDVYGGVGGVDDTRTCVLLWRATSLLMYMEGWGCGWHEDLCSTMKGHFITDVYGEVGVWMTRGPVFYYERPLHYWCIWRGGGVDDTRTCVLL